MVLTKGHIRFFIHFAFHLKKNAEAIAMIQLHIQRTLEVIIHVKDGIRNFDKEILVLKMNRRSQKIETDELQALLDINSAQTEKELAM